jgi:hypothetical protein
MIKPYIERSADEHKVWLDGWHDHAQGRHSHHDLLVAIGDPHADYYLAGWKAVDEFVDEMSERLAPGSA